MADFYPLISRAVASLADNTPATRKAIYERATQVLVAQLRNLDPPVSEAEVTRQRLALEAAIQRIEVEQARPIASETSGAPVAVSEPIPSPPVAAIVPEPAARIEPARSARTADLPEASPPERDFPVESRDAGFPAPRGEVTATGARPRLDVGAQQTRRRALPWRTVLVGVVSIAVVAAIAGVAMMMGRSDAPPPGVAELARTGPAPSAGKIGDRVGADAPATPAQPVQPTPARPAQGQPATPPPRADIAVAQRAVLYIEPTDPNSAPRAVTGRVAWRLEAQNAGQGQPLEQIIRADVDVPEAGLQLVFTIRRNTDPAFPAAHIIGLRFNRTADDGTGAVREAGVPQFKTEEAERGAPLSAITSALGDNLFVTATSRVPVELNRNLELMRNRNWIDIPIRFASGRRAIVAFEKGVSGEQRMAEGFTAWGQ
jgi:hypothetical protein